MPTYDYRCNNCGHEFELFQQMSDPVKRKCSECETLKLKRLVGTGAGVMFKGSGFYETDYRSDSYRKGAKAEKEASKPKDKDKKKKGDSGKSETSTSSKD
jgi:putative FmdB family regulatory protein